MRKLTNHTNLIDCLNSAGFNTSHWQSNSDPSQCFMWSFIDRCNPNLIAFTQWVEEESAPGIVHTNARVIANTESPHRYNRAIAKDMALAAAFTLKLPVRMILISGRVGKKVEKRELDVVSWKVTDYDIVTGDATIKRLL